MPILFGLLGILLIISGWNNTYQQLGAQLNQDFTGGGQGIGQSFLPWLGAIAILWMLSGTSPKVEKPAKALFGLVVLVFIIKHNGVFQQFQAVFTGQASSQAPTSTPITLPQGPAPVEFVNGPGGSSGGSSNPIGAATNLLGGPF